MPALWGDYKFLPPAEGAPADFADGAAFRHTFRPLRASSAFCRCSFTKAQAAILPNMVAPSMALGGAVRRILVSDQLVLYNRPAHQITEYGAQWNLLNR